MKLGTENKKSVIALAVLGSLAAYMVYSQLLSGPSATPAPGAVAHSGEIADALPATADKAPVPDVSRAAQDAAPRSNARSKTNDFHPKLRSKKKEERNAGIVNVDPTLRKDLWDRAMEVPPAGGERDLFQILKTPPVHQAAALPTTPEPKVFPFVGPRPPVPPAPPPPPPPPPPPTPITLKYFAYSALHPDGKRTAYFLDSDDTILEAVEGTMLKGRYRIVQIGLEKVLVEDTVEKRRQSINFEPEGTG